MKKMIFCLLVVSPFLMGQEKYRPAWESLDTRQTPAWFEDAKFGIFVHWGLYSVPAWAPVTGEDVYSRYAEWYWYRMDQEDATGKAFRDYHNRIYGPGFRYQDFVSGFKAEHFDPDKWAAIIENAGAKYVVLTSKHHEGFALWPSDRSVNWNSVDVGPHRDICGELTEAVRKRNLKMGFYFSLYEWHHPLYHQDIDQYVDHHMLPQLKDLTTRYHPEVIWADGEWDHPGKTWKSEEFLAWLYNESPVKETVVVNDRWGSDTRSKHGSFYTTEYDLIHDSDSRGMTFSYPWEECRGIAGSFGYNRNENLEDYSTGKELIHLLIEKVARGGNLLLNIGPTADGRIPVIMQQRLSEIGEWLSIHGEAIYGTRPCKHASPEKKEEGIYFTTKGKDLYMLVTNRKEKAFVIKHTEHPKQVTLLGSDKQISFTYENGQLTIYPPSLDVAEAPSLHAWVYKLENACR